MTRHNESLRLREILTLLVLALIAACVNLPKAIHIDDTAYLEMARAILRNPLHPLSEKLNWTDTARPIFETNQPLLVPCLLALWMLVFGENDLLLHIPMALCSTITIVLFYRLARQLDCCAPLYLTALFALGPAFLVSQNLMVDIPLLMWWLLFFCELTSSSGRSSANYWKAAGIAGLACLTKYVSLVLLPILAATIIYRKHYKSLTTLILPLGILAAWSAFNIYDSGSVHIMGRPLPGKSWEYKIVRLVAFVGGLGAVSPFALGFLSRAPISFVNRILGGIIVLLGISRVFLFSSDTSQTCALWFAFLSCGGLLLWGTFSTLRRSWFEAARREPYTARDNIFILAMWVLGTTFFIVANAPFMAIRHVLLVLPVILIALGWHLAQMSRNFLAERINLATTALLGIALSLSDLSYASAYRDAPQLLRPHLTTRGTVYHTGHWGWQWYASKAGMKQYDYLLTQLQEGDLLVVPDNIDSQVIQPQHLPNLTMRDTFSIPASPLDWLRTMSPEQRGLGFYAYGFPFVLPYRLSTRAHTFAVYEVETANPKAQDTLLP